MNFTNVRYGKMRLVARFKTDREDLRPRDRCVVRTDRGKEVGEVLTALEPMPETLPPESLWDVIRRASPEDLQNAERLEKENAPRAVKACKEFIKKLNLPMKVTDVDYVFGGERIIFYFTSQTRVDFRELVRQLAHEFRTRIELKQVGARDEARLIGDAGHCGLTLCCRSHLKELGGITMDMAKVQKHTADPSKITGRCGKLLCCLRYEYTFYTEARELLPPKGMKIESKKGTGVVVDQNLLLREVTIVKEGVEGRFVVKLDEIEGAPKPVAGCSGCAEPKAGPPPPVAESAPAGKPAAAAEAAPQEGTAPPGPPPAALEDTQKIDSTVRRRIEQDTKVDLPVVSDGFWIFVLKTPEVPPGKALVADLGGPKVAVFNVDGRFHVLSNACGHQGGPLGEGTLEGFSVTCPWHQWKFDVTTGKCLSVSGSQVRKYESRVDGEDLYIKV
jgi:cell fate regulator YaaT (PSP1 superfamily)/nitrite reductase/ring-hydroxylating ferredoxin subunit